MPSCQSAQAVAHRGCRAPISLGFVIEELSKSTTIGCGETTWEEAAVSDNGESRKVPLDGAPASVSTVTMLVHGVGEHTASKTLRSVSNGFEDSVLDGPRAYGESMLAAAKSGPDIQERASLFESDWIAVVVLIL